MRRPARLALVAACLAAPAVAASAVGASAAGAQVTPGDTGTTARPVPPWERRSPVRLAVGGGGLFQTARGAGAARVGDGGGFDAFGMLGVSALALGVGYQQSGHAIGVAGAGRVTDRAVFVEPRLSLAPFRNFNPYLVGRLSFVRRAVPGTAAFAAETRSLTGVAGGVGTLIAVAPAVHLDVAAMATSLSGGAAAGGFGGGTGGGLAVRAGVVVGFDRWNR